MGSRKNPVWRVVVADSRSPRDGRVIETVGRYNPQTDPSEIVLDEERIRHWLARGAQPTNTVKKLIRVHGTSAAPAGPTAADTPTAATTEDASAAAPADESAPAPAAEDEAAPEPADEAVPAPAAEDEAEAPASAEDGSPTG